MLRVFRLLKENKAFKVTKELKEHKVLKDFKVIKESLDHKDTKVLKEFRELKVKMETLVVPLLITHLQHLLPVIQEQVN